MAVTQGDVALRAGVARKTVSNVLADYPHVSPEVRRRVLAAMAELGYRPNYAAQSLRSGKTGLLALAVPELKVAYFGELADAVVEESERHGYTVLVIQTLGDPAREAAALDGFGKRVTEGLIYAPVAYDLRDVSSQGLPGPVVILGEQAGSTGMDHVGIDNALAARAATEHLLAQGCRRLAFLGLPGRFRLYMADLRSAGFRAALAGAGLPYDPALAPPVQAFHREEGYAAVQRLLADSAHPPFDGILCANDLLAQGAIRALLDRGVRVPEDVAVAGFDDVDEGRFSRPTLTSVASDKTQMAQVAVDLLVRRIGGDTDTPHNPTIDFTLKVRESSTRHPPPQSGPQ